MAGEPSKLIREIYKKQKRVELKKKAGKGVLALFLSIIALVFSDSLLKEESEDKVLWGEIRVL